MHIMYVFLPPCVVIVEEEEMSTSVLEREPQWVDPATGIVEVQCNVNAEHDE